ncbi:MAG: hypothetical protein IKN38_02660, partial [Clostridia bacterium]|nr:hypothetical protein [Clostridia bacterium]
EVFMDTREHAASHGRVTIENNVIECPDCDHAIMLRDLKSAHLENNLLVSAKEETVIDGSVRIM